ncbi:MAG: GNAT family N-acetyltransferase, partial [Actinobacteria bacterium]|nr:GNAT family N-acetyltransferase [Actinomycetota bacterium]
VEVSRRFGLGDETANDVEAWFDVPSHDLERDARIAFVDGSVAGYGDVSDAGGEGKLLWADVRAGRETATPLLDFVEGRARELGSAGARIKIWSTEADEEWRAFLESHGYEVDGYSFRMWTDLTEEMPAPDWPDGIAVRTYRRNEDERAVYDMHQEAFSEEPDFSRDPVDDWRQWSYREPFDSELWFLAMDGEEIAGIALCRPERGGDRTVGWVNILGVRKPWRGRGLGTALLQHAFRDFQARGKVRVGLGVDGRNPSAVRLYERAGMTPEQTFVWYVKAL